MKKHIENLLVGFKAECVRTKGKEIPVTYKNGWFKVQWSYRTETYRLKQFEDVIVQMANDETVTDRMEMVNGVSTLVKASQHVVQNLMSKKDVIEERDTPACCSVACETYWSM